MATTRNCFLIDIQFVKDIDILYGLSIANLQDAFDKYKHSYIVTPFESEYLEDIVVYTSNICQDIKEAFDKLRKAHIPPNVPRITIKQI